MVNDRSGPDLFLADLFLEERVIGLQVTHDTTGSAGALDELLQSVDIGRRQMVILFSVCMLLISRGF
jgi:hypothetical protein